MRRYQRDELNVTERVAITTVLLVSGGTVTAYQLADIFDIHHDTARQMLSKMSRVLPIMEDNDPSAHRWWYR